MREEHRSVELAQQTIEEVRDLLISHQQQLPEIVNMINEAIRELEKSRYLAQSAEPSWRAVCKKVYKELLRLLVIIQKIFG